MDITINELLRRLLIQMQKDSAASDEDKQKILKELEKKFKEEEISDEEK